MLPKLTKQESYIECQFCGKKAVVLDCIDESGHFNYVCKHCGEPQDD